MKRWCMNNKARIDTFREWKCWHKVRHQSHHTQDTVCINASIIYARLRVRRCFSHVIYAGEQHRTDVHRDVRATKRIAGCRYDMHGNSAPPQEPFLQPVFGCWVAFNIKDRWCPRFGRPLTPISSNQAAVHFVSKISAWNRMVYVIIYNRSAAHKIEHHGMCIYFTSIVFRSRLPKNIRDAYALYTMLFLQ